MKAILNKSFFTNVVALLIVLVGVWLSDAHCRTVGYYALSGALTNWLAVFMLFERVPFLYGSGVIPKHFEAFKTAIKHLIMEEFFTLENIEHLFKTAQSHFQLDSQAMLQAVDFDKLYEGLTAVILASSFGNMLNMLGGEQALQPLKEPVIAKLRASVEEVAQDPKVQAALAGKGMTQTSHQLYAQIETILMKRLNELTPAMVKTIIQTMIRRHLGWLVVWGGVFGGLIGLGVSFLA